MKKVGKLLIGVLSVGSLIGTAYATWTVNGGFTSKDGEIPFEITTVGNSDFDLEVKEKDTNEKIKFDAPKEYYGEENLSKSYLIKGVKKDGGLNVSPYQALKDKYWDLVSEQYRPNLVIKTEAIDKETKKALEGTRLENLLSYIALPTDSTINYKTWLDAQYENDGYPYTFTFSWSEKLGNNPQIVWKDLAKEEQVKNFESLAKAFDGVAFRYTIQLGGSSEVKPVEKLTGEITLPEISGSSLTIEGLKDNKLVTGEHSLTLTLDEGKLLKDDVIYINEDKVSMKKVASTTRATNKGYTYEGSYNFLEGVNYKFKYELVDEVKKGSILYNDVEHATVKFLDDKGTELKLNEEYNVGSKVTYKVTVDDGFSYVAYLNETKLTEEYFTLLEGENVFKLEVSKKEEPVKTATINIDDTLTGAEVTITDAKEDSKYQLGSSISFTVKANEGYELSKVYYTLNGGDKVYLEDYSFKVEQEGAYVIGYEVIDLSKPIQSTIEKVLSDTTYDSTHLYEVEGTVYSIEKAEYGRFTLVDSNNNKLVIYGSRIENNDNKSLSYTEYKYSYDFKKGDDPTPAMKVGYKIKIQVFGTISKGKYNNYYGVIISYESVDVVPTSITLENEMTMKLGDVDRKVTVTTNPSQINVTLEWSSSNPSVATISNDGIIHALSVGETEITAKYNDVISNKLLLKVEEGTSYTLLGEYKFEAESETISGNIYVQPISEENFLDVALQSSTNDSGMITSLKSVSSGFTSSTKGGIKLGASSKIGNLSFETKEEVSKIELIGYAWKNDTCDVTVNGVTLSMDKNTDGKTLSKTLAYTFNPTKTIEISTNKKRAVIIGIKLYK